MTATTSCAPCVLGAASTTLLSFPYSIIGTVSVQVQPHLTVINGTTRTVGFDTTTLSVGDISTTVPGPGGQSIVELTHASQLVWSAFGTELSYPTTYIGYLGFTGASATPSGCAESLSPTSLALPADINSASLVYPEAAGLPAGLLGYLDTLPEFTSQLGEPATACTAPGPIPAPASSVSTSTVSSTALASPSVTQVSPTVSTNTTSSVSLASPSQTTTTIIGTESVTSGTESTSFSVATTTITTSTTILTTTSTTIPTTSTLQVSPLSTTITSPTEVQTSSEVVATAQTVTYTPARIFSTITLNPIIVQSGTTTTFSTTSSPTALAVTLPNVLNPSALGSLLALTSSIPPSTTAAPYPQLNSTTSATPWSVVEATSTTYALLNGTSTTYSVPYTGAAQKPAQRVGLGWLEGALALALPALL